jgi:hypothetical protein
MCVVCSQVSSFFNFISVPWDVVAVTPSFFCGCSRFIRQRRFVTFIGIFASTFTLITQANATSTSPSRSSTSMASHISNNGNGTLRICEEESRACQDQNVHTIVVRPESPSESERPIVDTSRLSTEGLATSQDSSPNAAPSDELASDFQGQGTDTQRSSESAERTFRHGTDIARSEPSTSSHVPPTSSDSDSLIIGMGSDSTQVVNTSTSRSHVFSSNESSSAPSSVSISSRQVNVSGVTMSASRLSSPSIATTNSSPSAIQASTVRLGTLGSTRAR